ncbi:MAG: hypothetical protein GY714_00090 [Desulfobacterales bacterium]|nr:hypothetical protein [Desulfobacterales bacterium]MCP4160750.1 hypothetical protein [Deltaproteobacteria bacterium]
MQVDYIYEKGSGKLNEDFYFVNSSVFGVFDGATSLTRDVYENGLTGGYLASSIAGRTFYKNGSSLKELSKKANSKVYKAMEERGVRLDRKETLWSTSFAVVRIKEDSFEWAQTGDCIVLAIYEDESSEILTKNFDHDLETLMLWKKTSKNSGDNIMNVVGDKIAEVRANMNVTYGVLNGEKEALKFFKYGEKSLKGLKNILIFTDGLFIPKENPKEKQDFSLFKRLFLDGGLENIKSYIRDLEENDINCHKYPRFKTHDDIAAVSLTL